MKAARAISQGKFEIIEVPRPRPEPGKILVKLERIGICGSDLELISRPREPEEYPLLTGFSGHECIGVVEAAEPGLGFEVGDRVLIVPPEADGFVEWYQADPEWLVKQPKNLDPELLVVGQPLGTAIHCLKKLPSVVGKDIVILGQGGAGLLLGALLNRAGAQKVITVDLIDANLEISRRLGATHTINASSEDTIGVVTEITGGELADIVIEAIGAEETIQQCPLLVKKFGLVVAFGVPKTDLILFSYERFLRKQLRMIASDRTGDEPGFRSFKLAAQMLAESRIDVSPLITHRLPFERLQDAFDMQLQRKDGAVKVILEVD